MDDFSIPYLNHASFQCHSRMFLYTFAALGSSGVAQPTSFPKSIVAPSLVSPLRPEEDILFQWRLRRKIEQARECPPPLQQLHSPTFSWQAPSFCNPSDSRGAYKVRVIFCVPDPYIFLKNKFEYVK